MALTREGSSTAGAPSSASSRWSVVWGVGMLAIFVGERLIGSGGQRTAATGLGVLLVLAALVVRLVRRASRRARPARRREDAGPALRAGPAWRVPALLRPVRPLDVRVRQAPRAGWSPKLATALGRALAGALDRGRRFRSCSSSWPTPRWRGAPRLELAGSGRAMMSGLGWRARWSSRSPRLRRLRARQEDRPGLLPHRRPGEVRARSCATWISRCRSPLFFPAVQRGARGGRRLLRRPDQGVVAAEGQPLRLRHRSDEGQGVRRHAPTTCWCSSAGPARSSSGLPRDARGRAQRPQDLRQGGPAAPDAGGEAAAHGGVHRRPR